MRDPRVWVLLGPRTGDNNQALALAEALGLPFETRTLTYNLLRILGARRLGESLLSARARNRRWIEPPWPDLVIGSGWRSVPVARWIRKASGGNARLIRIGNPRVDASVFDLIITSRQYPVAAAGNVLQLPLTMTRFVAPAVATDAERQWLDRLARPLLLMAIGGKTKFWRLDPGGVGEAAARLCRRAGELGGSLLIVGSRRTGAGLLRAARDAIANAPHCRVAHDGEVRFPVLLHEADEIFVTGDSVSMLSEAVMTGKRVGLIPIVLTALGRRRLGRGTGSRQRDLRRFWGHLREQGLIGTIEQPASGSVADPAATAAQRVRQMLGDGG